MSSNTEINTVPSSCVVGSPTGKMSTHAWFALEIQQMMHGFGDVRKPLHETAVLIEEIAHQHIQAVVHKAAHAAMVRNGRFISLEDFLFLLRKDKVKLRRLIRYMSLKDLKMMAVKGSVDEDEPSTDAAEPRSQPKRRKKLCHDFLSSIDQTGELARLVDDESLDDIKHDRALRAELQTRGMDAKQYKEFCEARQTSFSRKYKSQRFRDWVMVGLNLEIKPNALAMEVLSYLSYETIAQILDLALLVRQDSNIQLDDPVSCAMAHVIVNHDAMNSQNMASVAAALAANQVKKEAISPTSPVPADAESSSQPSNLKMKPKKKKKNGLCGSMELGSLAIQPSEVWEAMRRSTHRCHQGI